MQNPLKVLVIDQLSLKIRFDVVYFGYSIVENKASQATKILQYLVKNLKAKLFKEMDALKKEIQLSLDLQKVN